MRRIVKVGNHLKGNILKPELTHRGYYRYRVMSDGVKRSGYAHRIVCEAFHGPPPSDRHQAAHNNGVKTDNHYTNLRWATPAENTEDNFRLGVVLSGEESPVSKLTQSAVEQMRAEYTGKHGQIANFARRFGVTHGCAWNVINGLTWNGGGK